MKEIFLVCILLAGMLPSGTPAEPVVLLANSIDRGLNSDFIDFLEAERPLELVDASEFESYKNSAYIVILGGNKAPEGVGDIVEKVLSEQEKNEIGKEKRMLVKLNLWQEGQVVVFLAGPDREGTGAACQENKKSYTSLLRAIETLRSEIITPGQVIAFLWPQVLLNSDRIAPYAPLQTETTKFPNLIPYSLKENCWFFWIDDTPYAKYAHPVRFVFYGVESQDSTVYDEEWWPVLNGKSLWVEEDEYWNKIYWVYNPGFTRPTPSFFHYRTGTALNQEEESAGKALVANGWKKGEAYEEGMAEDEKGATAILKDMDLTVERAKTVREIKTKLKNWARDMKPCNMLMIYITAHGGKGYVAVGGEKFTAAECAELLSAFDDGVHIFLIVDACHAGSFITDEMKEEAEVIITATSADKCAYRDFDPENDPNPFDKGSEFTSGLVESSALFLESQPVPLSPKDVYGRIFGSIEDVMMDAVDLDAAAINGLSDPQLWMKGVVKLVEEGEGYD